MTTSFLTGLSTTWTRPASCVSHWTYEASLYNNVYDGLLVQNMLDSRPDTDCLPPGFSDFGRIPAKTAIYSPGVCPAGYTTAAKPHIGDTTTAVCCLDQFTFFQTISTANYRTGTSVFEGCISTYLADAQPTAVLARYNTGSYNTTTLSSGSITMWAQPITIAFRQADVASQTATPGGTLGAPVTTSTSAATMSTTPVITSVAATQTPAAFTSAQPSLSTGSIVGIALGATAMGAIIIGLAIYFGLRRRLRESRTVPEQSSTQDMMQQSPLEKQEWSYEVSELAGTRQYDPSELSAQRPLIELG